VRLRQRLHRGGHDGRDVPVLRPRSGLVATALVSAAAADYGRHWVSTEDPKLFISYRREETAGHAGRLYDAVAARFGDRNVFIDVDLAPGVDFVQRITEAVAACDVLLVVIGPRWATLSDDRGPRLSNPGDYVRLEVETALASAEVTVIPVLVGGARMPKRDELPESVRALARRNALEVSDLRWRYDVGRLVGTLAERLEGPTEATGSTPNGAPPGSPAAHRRPGGKLVGAIVATLVVGLAAAVLALTGALSGENGGGRQSPTGSEAGTATPTIDDAVALVGQYESLYEAKDLDGLRRLMAPSVVLRRGEKLELRGADAVIEEYEREFRSFGDRQPTLDWEEKLTDANEELFEVDGRYVMTVGDEAPDVGDFGFLMQSTGSQLLITEICRGCPELDGGLL
jgi:hypothetical protein